MAMSFRNQRIRLKLYGNITRSHWSGLDLVLSESNRVTSDTTKSSKDRYHAIYKLMEERDEELRLAFDDLRRLHALLN